MDIPDDPELESAMMELGEEVVDIPDDVELEDAMMDLDGELVIDYNNFSMEGFDREILEDYNSQLYQLPEEMDIEDDFLKWLLGDGCDTEYGF